MDSAPTKLISSALSMPSFLQPLLIALDSHGICPKQTLQDIGLSLEKIEQKENHFFKALIGLLECGYRSSGDPLFAARASRLIKIEHLGMLGLLLKSGGIGELFKNLSIDLFPVLPKPLSNIFFKPEENQAEIEIVWDKEDEDDSLSLLTEYILGCLIFCAPLIIGRPANWKHVNFTHSSHAPATEYEQIFGCPVTFNSKSNNCVSAIDAINADEPHNEALFNELKLLFFRLLRNRENEDSTDIRTLITSELITRRPNECDIAERLSISESTLRRHLSARGTTFQKELDNAMREIATQMLGEESMDIKDVAAKLQYSDPCAFHRAFKRWTGLTPTQYIRGYRK